jgi:hypothetical protein
MTNTRKTQLAFATIAGLLLIIGFAQSWNVSLGILNLCLISAVMALGVNMQWGYAGLLNVGARRRERGAGVAGAGGRSLERQLGTHADRGNLFCRHRCGRDFHLPQAGARAQP